MLQAGLVDAFEHIPIHLDFDLDCPVYIQYLFSGFLGASVGVILACVVREISKIIND